jgi:transcriptional regulator with XRE-family HTH domain
VAESETPEGPRSLAERINQAFETLHPADRGPYTNTEVAEWCAKNGHGDTSISVNYIAALRSGSRNNPTLRHLRALASFFQIPASYFIEDGEYSDEIFADLQLVAAMRDADVRQIAARAMNLDPSMRSWLRDTVSGLPQSPEAGNRSRARRRRFQASDTTNGPATD